MTIRRLKWLSVTYTACCIKRGAAAVTTGTFILIPGDLVSVYAARELSSVAVAQDALDRIAPIRPHSGAFVLIGAGHAPATARARNSASPVTTLSAPR
jgi:hypothetical protein